MLPILLASALATPTPTPTPTIEALEKASQQAIAAHGAPSDRCSADSSLWVREPTVLDVPLAEVLAGWERGSCLALSGVHTASPEALAVLAQSDAYAIELDGLTTLDGPSALALWAYGRELSLGGLTEIGEAATQALADEASSLEGPKRLTLGGLTSLDGPEARALTRERLVMLALPSLRSLSPEAAAGLASWSGSRGMLLQLHGIERLTPEAAAGLSAKVRMRVEKLELHGLTQLDVPTARALNSGAWKAMALPLHAYTPETLSALAGDCRTTYLHGAGTKALTPEQLSALATCRQANSVLYLDELETLDAAQAAAIAPYDGLGVHLSALARAEPGVCAALTAFAGDTLTLGFESLSDADATQLAAWKGTYLTLPSLKTTPEVIAILEGGKRNAVECPQCERKPR